MEIRLFYMEVINMDINYYNGYLLDNITIYDMCNRDKKLMDACAWMIDNHTSIRKTAENFDYSRSTFHRHIHQFLPTLSSEMYTAVLRLLLEGKIC